MHKNFAKKFMLLITLFFGVIIGMVALKNIKVKEILKGIQQPTTPIHLLTLEQKAWPLIIEQPATIKAKQEVLVSAMINGHIKEILVQPGQHINKDQVMLKLDATLYEFMQQKAQAAYNLAQFNFLRDSALYEEETISTTTYNTSVALFNQAQADLEQACTQVSYHTIRAPFSGVVDYFDLNIGDYVQLGQPLIQIYSAPPHDVEFSLAQEYFFMLTPKHSLEVQLNKGNFKATLSIKGQGVSALSRRFLARAHLEEKSLSIPGEYASVHLQFEDNEPHYVVPAATLDYTTLGSVVWHFIPDQRDALTGFVLPIEVTIYRPQGDYVAIKGTGLQPNMLLVSQGQMKLQARAKAVIHE